MLKRYIWLGIVGVIALSLAAGSVATPGKSDASQVLKMAIGAEPPSLDPGLATDTTSANIIFNLMEPLVRLGKAPALKAVPGAASSWSVRGKTVTLNLAKNVRWSNGKPVVASDYVWSWLRTISPELGSDYAYQFYGIKGAEAYNSCKSNCNALRAKVGVKAVGKYKLVVQLTSAQPWFIQQLSHHSFLPVYKPAVTKYGSKWTEPANIVTDGPFKLSGWAHDASVTLVKNPKWRFAKRVKLSKIIMQIITDGTTAENAFRAGNIDLNTQSLPPADVPAWKKTKFFKVYKALAIYYYGFNVKNVPSVTQRRAMAYAIDRYQITKYILRAGQQPARGVTPLGIAGGPTIDKDSVMPAKAKVSEAKSLMSKVSNPKKNITLYVNNSPGHVKIATAVQFMWKQLGIDVKIKVMEWKQYLQFLGPPPNSDVDVYRNGWVYDFPDAYNGLVLFTCNSGNNNTNWCNKKFDGIIDKATKQPNFAKRVQLYRQAERIISGAKGDVPLAPIYWYVYTALVRPNVKGFLITPTDQFDFTKVSIR
jgi:oligopeptide transport system substrate-binding protein